MKLLAVLHGPPGSGSDTTIRRISGHLTHHGHAVVLADDPGDPKALSRLAHRHGAEALIGTHALICGQSFYGVDLPYVVIFGGTDLNEYAFDPDSLAVMTKVVDAAASLVAFTDDFVDRCLALWPHVEDKLRHIPQAVQTRPAQSFSLAELLGLDGDARVLLLPSGLRPIKDPMLLFNCITRWHDEDPRVRLVIAGHSYDEEFEGIVRRRCDASPGIDYVGALSRADLQAAMRQSAAVLNTSLSECSPNALLEAMQLGCRVMARNIPGNTCVVQPDVTGLIFDDPDDFRRQAQRLLDDPRLGDRLAGDAQKYIKRAHGIQHERAAYGDLIAALTMRATESLDGADA